MGDVWVRGASDDLIEVEGALSGEFDGGDEPRFLHFNEGTVLRVWYGDKGVWRLERERAGTAAFSVMRKVEEDEDGYSDIATLTGDLTSVACWGDVNGPTREDLETKIETWLDRGIREVRGAEYAKVLALWQAIESLAAAVTPSPEAPSDG